MDTPSQSIHAELRRTTAPLHRSIEEHLDLLGAGLSLTRYGRVLEMFLGFYEPMEASLRAIGDALPRPGFEVLARSPLLERDLRRLGRSADEIAALPRCRDLPQHRCVEHLAGSLYVLEGASLGGRMISAAVERRLGVRVDEGAAFFAGGGEHTALRWRAFLEWLETLARDGARHDLIHDAARETFVALEEWAVQRGAAR